MGGILELRYRPTPGQVLGRAIHVGTLCAAATAVGFGLRVWLGEPSRLEWLVVVIAFVLGTAAAVPVVRRAGVDADETGLYLNLPRPRVDGFAPWHRVADVRAERRGNRTVPVIYLDGNTSEDSGVWRLPAPYDGPGLAHDPRLDEKILALRNLWEAHRRRLLQPEPRYHPSGEDGRASGADRNRNLFTSVYLRGRDQLIA